MMAGIKKGSLVRVVKEQLEGSLEAKASDVRLPSYLFDSKGEILDVNDDYALVQFYVPTPNVWLRLDQLEEAK
ncbi:NAD(P)H-quinone oxidoreductase subunit O [Waterburya agarophytonicola K14]|uniref:NAD(P)H-quinone oxidoreductase subunit O n=1 Tax=Waterburya agarophytonicola KI4 TaxID=2874699 RepID=A0A964BMY0_9CYAN|nr:NAD(P)H-quinone oxidoreductase subunit O [Waterburya agarophytonicola KI4]